MYLRLRTKTDIDFATNHVYRHSFATRPVENGVDYRAYLLWWGTQMSAFPCDDMPQQNTIFFVNRSTCFIKLNVGWFSKAEALSILAITQEKQHRGSIPCCSFIIIIENALHPVIAIDYAIGAAHSPKAAPLLGNQLFQQPHPQTWPLLFGYAQRQHGKF